MTSCPLSRQAINVYLLSDVLGSFEETFQWMLRGSDQPVLLHVKGEVVGPQFELDTKQLDFGLVSFGFR
jgi:hypothetical protein